MKNEWKKILNNEGLENWKIIKSSNALCMDKTIWCNDDAMFLHELAHALIPTKINKEMGDITGHHSIWGDKYTNLIRKYMILKL